MARMVLCSAKMAAGEAATGRRKAGGTLLGKEAKQVGAIPPPLTFWGKANTKLGPRCHGRLQRAREEKSCWGLRLICSTMFHRLFLCFSLLFYAATLSTHPSICRRDSFPTHPIFVTTAASQFGLFFYS